MYSELLWVKASDKLFNANINFRLFSYIYFRFSLYGWMDTQNKTNGTLTSGRSRQGALIPRQPWQEALGSSWHYWKPEKGFLGTGG